MVRTKSNSEGPQAGKRVIATSGAIEWPERSASGPATRTSAMGYDQQTLPISLPKPAVPPWARELTRLLDNRPGSRDELINLRSVERLLRMPGAAVADLSDEVLRAAGLELRWLARREVPSRALARLLDQFEHELVQPALRRLHRSREQAAR